MIGLEIKSPEDFSRMIPHERFTYLSKLREVYQSICEDALGIPGAPIEPYSPQYEKRPRARERYKRFRSILEAAKGDSDPEVSHLADKLNTLVELYSKTISGQFGAKHQ